MVFLYPTNGWTNSFPPFGGALVWIVQFVVIAYEDPAKVLVMFNLRIYLVSKEKKLLSIDTLSEEVFERKGPLGFIVTVLVGFAVIVSAGSNIQEVVYAFDVAFVTFAWSKLNVFISITVQL